jgi:hypothetical protein
MTREFINVTQSYNNRVPITWGFTGCEEGQDCSTTVFAAALVRHGCTTKKKPLDYEILSSDPASAEVMGGDEWSAFEVDITWNVHENDTVTASLDSTSTYEYIDMTVSYFNATGPRRCAGEYITTHCQLRPAIGEYPIHLRNSTVTFGTSLSNPKIKALANNTWALYASGTQTTTLGGLYLAGYDLFSANVSVYMSGAVGMWQLMGLNTFSTPYVNDTGLDDQGDCARNWRDPTDDIMAGFNQLMFRTSLGAANVKPTNVTASPNFMDDTYAVNQSFPGIQRGQQNVYKTHYGFLGLALGFMVVAISVGNSRPKMSRAGSAGLKPSWAQPGLG